MPLTVTANLGVVTQDGAKTLCTFTRRKIRTLTLWVDGVYVKGAEDSITLKFIRKSTISGPYSFYLINIDPATGATSDKQAVFNADKGFAIPVPVGADADSLIVEITTTGAEPTGTLRLTAVDAGGD